MNVTAGTPLFHLVDPTVVQVVGHVPESQVARARLAKTAQIEVPSGNAMLPAGRLVSIGQVLDPLSRTLPITFAANNRTLGLAVGQSVFVHLLLDQSPPAPALPEHVVAGTAARYREAYERLTGQPLDAWLAEARR
jgi:multidrug resistance efflux pump